MPEDFTSNNTSDDGLMSHKRFLKKIRTHLDDYEKELSSGQGSGEQKSRDNESRQSQVAADLGLK